MIKTNVRVISEAKQLDSDMQKLVYENYSRFMSASKTVRTLQVCLVVKCEFRKMLEIWRTACRLCSSESKWCRR